MRADLRPPASAAQASLAPVLAPVPPALPALPARPAVHAGGGAIGTANVAHATLLPVPAAWRPSGRIEHPVQALRFSLGTERPCFGLTSGGLGKDEFEGRYARAQHCCTLARTAKEALQTMRAEVDIAEKQHPLVVCLWARGFKEAALVNNLASCIGGSGAEWRQQAGGLQRAGSCGVGDARLARRNVDAQLPPPPSSSQSTDQPTHLILGLDGPEMLLCFEIKVWGAIRVLPNTERPSQPPWEDDRAATRRSDPEA